MNRYQCAAASLYGADTASPSPAFGRAFPRYEVATRGRWAFFSRRLPGLWFLTPCVTMSTDRRAGDARTV